MKLHELKVNKSGGNLTTAAGTRRASIRGVPVRRIEVWLGYGSSEEQGREVEAAFSEAGIPVEIRYESAYPGIGNGAGFTIFIGIFGYFLGDFINGFLKGAGIDVEAKGEEAWQRAKGLLRTLKEDHLRRYPSQPPSSEGLLVFKDPKRRTQVNLRTDLPDEAWAKLAELDLEGQKSVAWTWDDTAGKWIEYDLSDFEDDSPLGPSHPDVQ
ncbi:MAG TPA: hypothetical protein VFT79_02650 [Solirubrobacterales bacterium]|nr:hypothetical protein [Solirubrobacterales bacterium]